MEAMNTPEEKAAFIKAQSIMMEAELQMMLAENKKRERNGYALAYAEQEFSNFINKWESVLGYNALCAFFRD